MTTRRRLTGEFKARVALEALRGDETVQEIAVHGASDKNGQETNGSDSATVAMAKSLKNLGARRYHRTNGGDGRGSGMQADG